MSTQNLKGNSLSFYPKNSERVITKNCPYKLPFEMVINSSYLTAELNLPTFDHRIPAKL